MEGNWSDLSDESEHILGLTTEYSQGYDAGIDFRNKKTEERIVLFITAEIYQLPSLMILMPRAYNEPQVAHYLCSLPIRNAASENYSSDDSVVAVAGKTAVISVAGRSLS